MTRLHPKREAREFAVRFLYHLQLPNFGADIQVLQNSEKLNLRIKEFLATLSLDLSQENYQWATDRIHSVVENTTAHRTTIKSSLGPWRIERLGKVDLAVLLVAVDEWCFGKTDFEIIVNEAIEIAKIYGQKDSPRFVNGTLEEIRKNTDRS